MATEPESTTGLPIGSPVEPEPSDPQASAQIEGPAIDVGPDPVWGIGLFFLGLLGMGINGALTNHWMFNLSTAILLLGSVLFLASVAITIYRQDPASFLGNLRTVFRGLKQFPLTADPVQPSK